MNENLLLKVGTKAAGWRVYFIIAMFIRALKTKAKAAAAETRNKKKGNKKMIKGLSQKPVRSFCSVFPLVC